MSSLLRDYQHDIFSAVLMTLLSVLPFRIVGPGALFLAFLICLHNLRPHILMKRLQLQLSSFEESLEAAVESGVMSLTLTNKFTEDRNR